MCVCVYREIHCIVFVFVVTSLHSLCSVSPSVCFLPCDLLGLCSFFLSLNGCQVEKEMEADRMARQQLPALIKGGEMERLMA